MSNIKAADVAKLRKQTGAGMMDCKTALVEANGDFDTCIALRTAITKNNKFYAQAGAGIVADSKPLSEYNETVNKAKALINSLE